MLNSYTRDSEFLKNSILFYWIWEKSLIRIFEKLLNDSEKFNTIFIESQSWKKTSAVDVSSGLVVRSAAVLRQQSPLRGPHAVHGWI